MDGFERRRKSKMEAIVGAALTLFCARGFKDVSIAEIAARAKVSPVSIYNFFGSKENLARQSVFTLIEEKTRQFEALIDSNIPFREKLASMTLERSKGADRYSEEFFQSAAGLWNDPAMKSFREESYQTRTVPLIIKLVEQGQKEGSIRSSISTDAILLYVDMFKNVLTRPGISSKVRVDLGELFFHGFLGKPEAP